MFMAPLRLTAFIAVLGALTLAPAAHAAGWGVKQSEVRWLLMPGGERFYSVGADTVNGGHDGEKAKKNQGYYWKRYYKTHAAWARDAETRLRKWGFNTLGGWSDPTRDMRLPLIPELDLGRNARLHWFDMFAPDSPEIVFQKAKELTEKFRNDKRTIGYFTDNEAGWWNAPLFSWYLKADESLYAKRALLDLVKNHYGGNWNRLLEDFVPGPGADSFDDLRKPGARLKLRPGGYGIRLIDRFTYICARRYYKLVRDALKRADREALVIGDRLPLYYHQDAVRAAAGLVDVLSTNYNVDVEDGWVAPYYFEGLAALNPAPVLISEFFFAAKENRSGNANNGHLMHVTTQEERARGAAAAARNFAKFPNVTGAHWFQYYDEPTGGRGDGEDFNMGLVDIHNDPYEGLTSALKEANAETHALHEASSWAAFKNPRRILKTKTPINVTDNSLADWTDKAGTRLTGFTASPKPYMPFGDVHVAWDEKGLSFMHLAENYADLSLLDYQGDYPLSETYQIHVELETKAGPRHFAVHLTPKPHEKYEGRFELVPSLYEYGPDGSARPLDSTGLLQALDRPLPHIAVEFFLPASMLGLERLSAGNLKSMRIRVGNFYREMEMSSDGGPIALVENW